MADTYRFFNIGKANAEITRLESELAKANEERDRALGSLKEIETVAESQAASVEKLTGEVTAVRAELSTATEKHKTDLAALETSVETRASTKAAAIVEGMGLKVPVTAPKPNTSPDDLEALRKQATEEKDPIKKAALARKLRDLRGHKGIFDPK